jgi:oligoribonuclease NrnB/cAMP/cGMP phosphodiesterase (DHH superfamily)
MPGLFCTHIDGDGLGAALIATYFNDFDKIIHLDYGFEINEEKTRLIESFDEIYFCDITPNEAYYNRLKELGKSVTIYDHHDGENTQYLRGLPGVHFDPKRCGTEILFDVRYRSRYRVKPIIQEYVTLVSVYDLWKWDHPLWEEAISLTRVLYGYKIWGVEDTTDSFYRYTRTVLKKFEKLTNWRWTEEELGFIAATKTREDEALRDAIRSIVFRKDDFGRTFGVFQLGAKISLTCHRFLRHTTLGRDLDYLLVINTFKGMNGKLSGRCLDGRFKVNELRVLNGHPEAAGGTITVAQAEAFYKGTFGLSHKDDPDDSLLDEFFVPAQKIELNYEFL